MNRRILSAIAAVLGFVVVVLAVCSATVWRPSSTATATLTQVPDQPYLLVEPGVLGLVDSDVAITATAEGSSVLIAVGYSADARAWLADDPYVSVTGLTDWTTLSSTSVTERCADDDASTTGAATEEAQATDEAQASDEAQATDDAASVAAAASAAPGCTPLTPSGADPSSSILWQEVVAGEGSATVTRDATDSDLVVLLATDGTAPAPTLTLSWPRAVSTPFFVPGLVLGGLLILAGVASLLFDHQMRRADEERRRRAAARLGAGSVITETLPRLNDPNRPLTRREQRDKERAESAGEEWIDPRTGIVYLDGVAAPEVPQAGPELRDAGAPRGSAVVPGLDWQTTAAHRSARAMEEDSAFAVADTEQVTGPAQEPSTPYGEPTDSYDEENNR